MSDNSPDDYGYFGDFAAEFARRFAGEAVDGADYGQPGVTVYYRHTLKLPAPGRTKGRLEVNLVTPEAIDFEWQAEITLNDKVSGEFVHLIVRGDGSVVETYGKTVLPLTPERSGEVRRLLTAASAGA